MGFSYLSASEFIRHLRALGTPEGQLEQASASGTREALETPARLSCGPCIVCWQEILSPSSIRSAPSAAPHPLERPQGNWNGPWPMERPPGLLEQPQATGTAFGLGPPAGLFAATRLRVCDGNAMNVRWACDASFLGPPKISDFWGEQRPWSPADLVERYRLCDPSAECECKITAFFWHGNGLSRMLWGLCPLTCTMLRMHNPFYGLSPLSLSFHGCLWKSVPRVCKQPEPDVICIFEKRKLFTFYMYSFLDS